MFARVCVCMCALACVCGCLLMHVHDCASVFICVCVCVWGGPRERREDEGQAGQQEGGREATLQRSRPGAGTD